MHMILDMSSDSPNQDVRCAVLASSTVLLSFCEFFWTDLKSLFVLRSGSPSTDTSSSITLAWCTLNNSVDHLTPIVEDMRENSSADILNMNIVGTRITNMKVVGTDGICVSQTNHRKNISSFEDISTTVSEMRIVNVSSQPGEVKKVSALFSQRMVGCAILGSNNHLSGSVLRDVNGGGSFLCSNSTFDWCHTTSSERPSLLSHTSGLTQRDNAETEFADKSYDGEERFPFTDTTITFLRCDFKNMKYTITSSSVQSAGGSALYISSSTSSKQTALSLISCTFSNCSITSSSIVYGGCVYLYDLRSTKTNTVEDCCFDDWYPSNDGNINQFGGGIGTYSSSAPVQITTSNFTLNGHLTNKNNGGFISSYSSYYGQSWTIANSRLVGDSKTTGLALSLCSSHSVASSEQSLSVTDSLILNTNSKIDITRIAFKTSSGFTRTEITNTSITCGSTSTSTHPFHFLDSSLNQCSISTSSSPIMLLVSGTSFTGKPNGTSSHCLSFSHSSYVVFHKCDFTDCSPASASKNLIYSYNLPSLVVDTCSFTRCSAGQSTINVVSTYSFFSFCSFTNVSGKDACVMASESLYTNFFESCRFDLETVDKLDFKVTSNDVACLNETAVIGCTSNRQMYFGTTWANREQLIAVQVVPVDANKNEIRVGTWPPESEEDPQQQIPTFSSLSEALAALPTPPKDIVITFSDGNFTKNALLEVSQLVEIVGAGLNISDVHSTQLKTNGFVSKSAGKLTLQSLRLVPSSSSSGLASTEGSGSLFVLNVFVEDISEHSSSLFQFAAGSSEIRHSFFKNIESIESLICVSQTSSLVITNTLFVSITRTSLEPTPYETTQCASCIEGKTSGTVKVLYCRFGACKTNGRAGAIDLEKSDDNSAVEMGSCCFDQNSAGNDVPNAVRGDDAILKSFDDSKLALDLSTIQSFPSLQSFLINSEHTIVPPPFLLHMSSAGVDHPLTWTNLYNRISKSLLQKHTLQYLLVSRFQNNIQTKLQTNFDYSETMTPFIFQNSTVHVRLNSYRSSIITVVQQNKVFVTIQKASLSFTDVQFAFEELTTPAFTCDKDSSIELRSTAIKLTTPTLTQPFIDSVGPYVYVNSQFFIQNITLDRTPFIQLNRAEKDASLQYSSTTPLLANPLITPFIVCEGAKQFMMASLKLNYSFINSASFADAKDSTVRLISNNIQLLQSTTNGAFLHLQNGAVSFSFDSCNSSSGVQGGLVYCRNSTVTTSVLKASSCSASQGGVLYSEDCSVSISTGSFTSCRADEGGVACLISSSLTISTTSFELNSAKRGGVFWVDLSKDSGASLSFSNSPTFTANTASDVDKNGVDSGKGGAIFVTGTTNSENPIYLNNSFFDENSAAFGNDVFVEKTVLGEAGPNLLKYCNGYSNSNFPHLEIEDHSLDDAKFHRISDFIPFKYPWVTATGADTPKCKWGTYPYCKTIKYTLQYLSTTNPNGSLFQRKCFQLDKSMTTDPVKLEKNNLFYVSFSQLITVPYSLSLSASYDAKEGVVFTIDDESKLTIMTIKITLKQSHQVVKVNSQDGRVVLDRSFVLSESGTITTLSPISSVGSSILLSTVSFSPALTTSIATLSAPLVIFAPQPSEQDVLGSGSFEMKNVSVTNVTFVGTSMIELSTTGNITLAKPKLSNVQWNHENGMDLTLKGRNFKTQLKPKQWDEDFKTKPHLTSLLGEDIWMDESEKWRRVSLVYWLVSPSSEVVIGEDVDAVDHPNCGSLMFKCTTLDSAFSSAGMNSIDTISCSVSATLSSSLSVDSSLTFKSFSNEKQTITFDEFSSMTINKPHTLSLTSLIFTVAGTCSSPTLFVVEKGEIKFSSCLVGSSDSSLPLVVPASTTKLIEVLGDGTLTLTDTLIQHVKFTHSTLGTAIRLHLGATVSSSRTRPIVDVSSKSPGSHVQVVVSTDHDADSLSDLSTLLQTWGPTLTHSPRYSKAEIDEFVVIEDGRVDELIYRWHPYDSKTLYVDRSGGSRTKCGLSVLPCSSLSSNLAKLGTDQVIKVCDTLDETVSITTTRDLSIMSSDTSQKEFRVSETSSFTSIGFTLSFTSISFIPLPQSSNQNADINTRTESLFIVESGSLSLTSCSVSSFELSSSPLITHTSGTLTLQSCSVSSITRSSGNGTVLSTEMSTGKSLLLDEIEFSSMSSSKESPILALSFTQFIKSTPDPLFDFTLTNLNFSSMSGMESELPCFISLVGHDLASWIGVGDVRFNDSYSEDSNFSDLWSVDETFNLSVSLLFYLRRSDGPVGVSSSGYEMPKCGSNSVWCSTIKQSLTRLSPQNTKKIIVMDEVTLSNSIELPDELTFAGNPIALSTCVVSAAGSFVSEGIDSTTISKLTFSLPSTQTAEAVIVHSSTKLTLSDVELSSTAESSACFLKVTAGKAEMSNIEIRSEMAENSILFSILGGRLSVTGTTATSSSPMKGRLFSVSNTAFNLSDVKLSKQTFTNALFECSSFGESTISDMGENF
ncbi:hypothetical protein BLNAU_23965 [Blattamonas nauphoetae]|uniref:Uncharacterized protein n=1 Tax=Blattamonas nauphoetae TaxID=2049346 RepID=A0ABQ9WNP8_9EUKA|nr:hypothetical protein BLNAU_23965 [Blattamonas nauphoetae]